MTAISLLFTLAAIGISETVYLIRKRKLEERPICPIGGGCTKVLTSEYNRLFGIHNDQLGLAFYLSLALAAALIVIGVPPTWLWFLLASLAVTGASVMSIYFIFLQWRVIQAWCFWCLMSAATVAGMAIILLSGAAHLITLV